MACYYRNGTRAVDDTPCPNANTCCPSGATCMDNLLCRDKNNHPNGSLTVFPDGHSYNYTGLYYTPSCQDKSYKGSVLMSSTLASAPSESGTPSTTAAATAAATASLSTGAKAGIGIGAAGAGIIIIVLVALLLRARRLAAVNRGPSQTEKNTFWASGARTRATQAELEACADAPPSELSAKPAPNRFELAS
ncbi:hypothetical protein KXV68_004883 [Aspergillus fumigatus]|nr:hypothetical protein KXX11_009938 [Aspergillus fumigatus]KAH1339522.1 hypothetical protein KXX67_008941 [Aspergillus fumigatus]KAH1375093.1 hypothetical protein KXX50_001425 [Aspergillus fumigatus]KAH1403795.1 hypothetical protein KXX51_001120 [Aspergillus fumigatus]KAH1406733.1 hypothetical protein KXX22_001012 [Aspergillus fumigatus]